VHPTVEYILYTTCTVGIIGALFIIITYLIFSDIRNRFGISLVFWLSVANLLDCVAFFPWNTDDTLCKIQALVIHFFQISSFFWSTFIGVSVFAVIYLDRMFDSLGPTRYMRWFHTISWGIGALTALPPFITGSYGRNTSGMEPWCYTPNGDDWARILVYGPCVLILLFNIGIFIAVRVKLSKWNSPESKSLKTNITLYVASFVVSQAPALINRIQYFFAPSSPIFTLILLQITLQPLQAFWNALIFCLTEPDCLELYSVLFRCSWRRRREERASFETAKLINYDYDYDCEDA